MTQPEDASSGSARTRSSSGFAVGVTLGVLVGAAIGAAIGSGSTFLSKAGRTSEQWDLNGDGVPDSWARYDGDGRLIESSDDRNHDRKPDSWMTYQPAGVLQSTRYDSDFDGREDYWELYEKGAPISYTADNDRDGTVDEWGHHESGEIVERNWSFANGRIADKRAYYQAGRKLREEFDRNRDGVFDETIILDEFERVISRR